MSLVCALDFCTCVKPHLREHLVATTGTNHLGTCGSFPLREVEGSCGDWQWNQAGFCRRTLGCSCPLPQYFAFIDAALPLVCGNAAAWGGCVLIQPQAP